jgi:chaperonin GroES
MNVRPFRDCLLVRRIEETKPKGSIAAPDPTGSGRQEGKVLAVGNANALDGGRAVPLTVKVGDNIVFGRCSGNEIRIDGEAVLVVRGDQVLAVLE